MPEEKFNFIEPDLKEIETANIVRLPELVDPYFTVNIVVQDISAATAANYGLFFTAPFSCEVIEAWEVHKTAGTDGGTVTLDIEKLTGTQALDAGVSVLGGTWDLKASANQSRRQKATTTAIQRFLTPGNRLALKDTGTLTAVAHVSATVLLRVLQTNLSTSDTP